ncbi:hypothetical protein AGABI2DRAFT_178568 [Agaricus bisporus var. bisporus H97]|uniref:hypothetical protein n=1 Tax=Agaricus bisporus var. bisporus (strain H97 / ATCC MYA-4626 / FGSC 10389) TaxID=936046 RepID=UPI00029F676F|nr:hypothetical protein AGABI2DRAFT_178568 [Agaricus bisporus var. bisporus H97]EKV47745.1 hypothetical protein AGABI2DRAFT_178568 [Agaricus bisporus var. bisporus H97]
MVCHILRKALGDAKPVDAAEINAYCRRASHDLVLRHLQQLYGDLNGNTFKQDHPPGNELHSASPRDQIHSGQQCEAPPKDPMHSYQQDKSSGSSSSLSDPPPLDYASKSTRGDGCIRRWLRESEKCRSQQSNTPDVNVARLLSLDDDRMDTLQERRRRARSYTLGKAEKKDLGPRTTKSLPALPTGVNPNITLQELEDISTSKLSSVKHSSDLLRRKSPEELEEIGVWKLEKLYGRSTQLCDRIRKRKNLEGIQKLCEEVNPIVEGWIENLVITPNLSDISDISEGVAGLQARRVDMTARQFGNQRKRDVENALKVVPQASDAGNEIPHVTPKFIYFDEETFPSTVTRDGWLPY